MKKDSINLLSLENIPLELDAYSSKCEINKETGICELFVYAKITFKKNGEKISPALECVSLARTLLSLEMFVLLYQRRAISYVNDSTLLVSLDVASEGSFLLSVHCGEIELAQIETSIDMLNLYIRELLNWLGNIAFTHGQKNWILNCITLQVPQDEKPEDIA